MIQRSFITLLSCVLLVACGPTARVDLPPTHPAHADAEESPVPTPSSALAISVLPTDSSPAPADHDHAQHTKPDAAAAIPTDTKPADTKPADTKPADTKPAGEDHSQHQKHGKGP